MSSSDSENSSFNSGKMYQEAIVDCDYAGEWKQSILSMLMEKTNSNEFKIDHTCYEYQLLSTELVKLISNICADNNIKPETEFACYDTCELYLFKQFKGIIAVLNGCTDTDNVATVWENEIKEFKRKIPILIPILILLVSKFYSQKNEYNCYSVRRILRSVNPNMRVSIHGIKGLEYHIYSSIGFKICQSAVYITMELLVQECLKTHYSDYEKLYKYSRLMLRMVYFRRNKIFERYFLKNNVSEDSKMEIQKSKLFTAAGVVVAALIIICGPQDIFNAYLQMLSEIVLFPISNFENLGREIVNEVLL